LGKKVPRAACENLAYCAKTYLTEGVKDRLAQELIHENSKRLRKKSFSVGDRVFGAGEGGRNWKGSVLGAQEEGELPLRGERN